MALPPTPQQPDNETESDVRDLKASVRHILARHGCRAIVDRAARIHSGPPFSLLLALRAPKGAPRLVEVAHQGVRGVADVNPQGVVDYAAELRAWLCICAALLQRRAA